jgi:enoyl-CoA hydratase
LRCAILTGAESNFSSGMDLRAMAGDVDPDGAIDEQARLKSDPGFVYRGLLKTYRPTKPVIAAVEGVAIAGGTEILQGTDIRVAGESARFGVSEARWSLYPMGGSAVRLQRQIPYTVAADILLTGKHILAPEAKEIGLVGHVVPDGEALTKAREIADTIAANGPLAVEAILRTLHETQHMSEADAFAHESAYTGAVMGSEDSKEGPRAFAEKRTPNFQRK